MGSFNATCIISGLPIESNDSVRYLLLTQSKYNPEGNGHICYVGGRWQLRSAAVKAEYDDYGSIDNIEDSIVTNAAFEAFKLDAIEKGVGDNQCHDVQVRRSMGHNEWLEALSEGRVFVRDVSFNKSLITSNWKSPEPEDGIPTISRLEAILKSEDAPVVTAYGAKGYTLDEVSHGFIRIRGGEYGKETEYLEEIVPAIQMAGYAAMITCGTGNYANHAELLVAPRPAPDGKHFISTGVRSGDFSPDYERPRPVAQAMVREDVWQILLGMTIDNWNGGLTFDMMKKDAISAAQSAKKNIEETTELKAKVAALRAISGEAQNNELDIMESLLLIKTRYRDVDYDNVFLSSLQPLEGVSGYSLREAFSLGLEMAKTDDELETYVIALAETAFVQWAYSTLHGQWHPTTNSGQDGNWKEHIEFLKKLCAIKYKMED